MSERRTSPLWAGFAAGLLLTGIPFWRLPYTADFWGDLPFQLGFVGLAAATAVLAASGAARLWPTFWAMLAAFPAAVAIRVAVEVAEDPTDHNLWPIELVLAAIFSLIAILPGLLVGALVRRARA